MSPGRKASRQLKMRARRLGVDSGGLYVLAETDMAAVIQAAEDLQPDVLIIDSIQTMYHSDNTSSPGSVSQVKDCTMAVMHTAKSNGLTAFIVGHVNKEGAIAGRRCWNIWWTAYCILKESGP